jgi:hypothetical protein
LYLRHLQRVFLELSPNKTWEGFIGGFLLTHLYAFVFAPVWCPAPLPSTSSARGEPCEYQGGLHLRRDSFWSVRASG